MEHIVQFAIGIDDKALKWESKNPVKNTGFPINVA